jgi:hypothetical protein
MSYLKNLLKNKSLYNIFEYFIFIIFIPNHTTCFHSIYIFKIWMLLNNLKHLYKLWHKEKLGIGYNFFPDISVIAQRIYQFFMFMFL